MRRQVKESTIEKTKKDRQEQISNEKKKEETRKEIGKV